MPSLGGKRPMTPGDRHFTRLPRHAWTAAAVAQLPQTLRPRLHSRPDTEGLGQPPVSSPFWRNMKLAERGHCAALRRHLKRGTTAGRQNAATFDFKRWPTLPRARIELWQPAIGWTVAAPDCNRQLRHRQDPYFLCCNWSCPDRSRPPASLTPAPAIWCKGLQAPPRISFSRQPWPNSTKFDPDQSSDEHHL